MAAVIPVLHDTDDYLLPPTEDGGPARPPLAIDLVLLAKRREIARRRELMAELLRGR